VGSLAPETQLFADLDSGRTLEETAALFDGEQSPQDLAQMGGEAATISMTMGRALSTMRSPAHSVYQNDFRFPEPLRSADDSGEEARFDRKEADMLSAGRIYDVRSRASSELLA
jgi:hypothetical protein